MQEEVGGPVVVGGPEVGVARRHGVGRGVDGVGLRFHVGGQVREGCVEALEVGRRDGAGC